MNDDHLPAPKLFAGFVSASVLLVVAMLVVGGVCGSVGFSRSGSWGVVAAVIAASVCGLSGVIGLFFTKVFRGDQAVHGLLAGILVRVGLPLATGIVLQENVAVLRDAGVFGMIVACYLVMLILETLLSIRMVQSAGGRVVRGG